MDEDYIFCEVSFEHSYSRYTYIADSDDYGIGDLVVVPVSQDNEEKIARIESIKYLPASKAPYPIQKTKHIIRKFDEDTDDFGTPPFVASIDKAVDRVKRITNSMRQGRTAYWIQKTHLFRADEYICSACRAIYGELFSICPSCGAYMKKSKYDPSWVDEMEDMLAFLDDDW